MVGNKVLWIQFEGILGGRLGVATIYAPNDSHDWCKVWEEMLAKLPTICYFILIGNFNMVKWPSNKFQSCGKLVPKVEKTLWDQMKSSFRVGDFLSSNGSFMLSWDNQRSGWARTLAQLNRVYLTSLDDFHPSIKVLDYSIHGDSILFDHLPLGLDFKIIINKGH
jgi:hypothetical protein